jgi:hypothetical protein
MLLGVLAMLLVGAPLPPECEPPPTRDVSSLRTFAQVSGTLSAGLDSVATWCFDKAGAQKSKSADCKKAVTTCQQAHGAVTPQLRALLTDALNDLNRPFLGARYVPKRSGLEERPNEASDCQATSRSVLFAAAQARMDVARLASMVQNEYTNYQTWLFAEGLKCSQVVAGRPKIDPTRKGMSVDTPVDPLRAGQQRVPAASPIDGGSVVGYAASGAGTVSLPPGVVGSASVAVSDAGPAAFTNEPTAATSPVGTRSSTLDGVISSFARPDAGSSAQTLLTRWRRYADTRAQLELDKDYVLGFSVSRELRDCHCTKLHPSTIVRRLEAHDGTGQLELEDAKHTSCEQCLLNAYSSWRKRADQQCTLLAKLTPFEVGVLERSDDGNGLPPRCFEAVRPAAARDSGVLVRAPLLETDAGRVVVTPLTVASTPSGGPAQATAPVAPATLAPATGPGVVAPSERNDGYVRPQDYAPVPQREEGRLYVRLFMSSACAAEVLPGPLQARTGDLLLMPYGATSVSVRSPCGGLAEVYFGREPTPRVSELFGRNQPLVLQFKAQ